MNFPLRHWSLEAKFTLIAGIAALTGVVSGALLQWLSGNLWLSLVAGTLVSLIATLTLSRRFTRPINRTLQALTDGVASFKDGDFSISLGSDREDELGELVVAYNIVGDVLRTERQNLFQRELLLDTVIQATPLALVLSDPSGRIVYSNTAARRLFNEGRKLEGFDFIELLEREQPAFVDAVSTSRDGLFTMSNEQEDDVYYLSHREFRLNNRRHQLYLFKLLTHELNRQEVATWKKVIRVISHELNNSLAPISSLAHSGRELSRRGNTSRMDSIFGTIEDRSVRLKDFIQGYARFAKLPSPQAEMVEWRDFMASLHELSGFSFESQVPDNSGWFDPAQIQQVMLNLLKNAEESGCTADEIHVRIETGQGRDRISVRDEGEGMTDNVLRHALLPFYSTKKSGTGLGLPLCREIVEAHGGRLSLANVESGGLEVTFWLPQPRPPIPS